MKVLKLNLPNLVKRQYLKSARERERERVFMNSCECLTQTAGSQKQTKGVLHETAETSVKRPLTPTNTQLDIERVFACNHKEIKQSPQTGRQVREAFK